MGHVAYLLVGDELRVIDHRSIEVGSHPVQPDPLDDAVVSVLLDLFLRLLRGVADPVLDPME